MKGWRSRYPYSTGEFIRSYLLDHGEGYIYEIWNAFKNTLKDEYNLEWWGSYTSFRKYFNYLQKLKLITFVREEAPKYPWLSNRRYFTLVPENIDVIAAWKNPQIILYPAATYGKRRYDKKKRQAERRGISPNQLALIEHPEIEETRIRLGL